METWSLGCIGVALLLAGCTTPAATPLDDEAVGLALLESHLVNDHDHSDPAMHPGFGWNMQDVWEQALPMNATGPVSAPSEFCIWSHYAFVSLFHPSAGIAILDIADPERPVQVGFFDAGTAYVNDVEVSPDGKWAFLPTMPLVTEENDPLGGGLAYVGDGGLQVVDISDLRNPRLATFWRAPGSSAQAPPPLDFGKGWHRLDIEVIDGAIHVFGTNNALAQIDIVRFEPTPVPHVVPVSSYQSPAGREAALNRQDGWASSNIHDVTVVPDPLDASKVLMGVAHWEAGIHLLDVTDPSSPELLGTWADFTVVKPGNVHNVEFTAVEGRRIAVVSPEYPVNFERQGILWNVDITDYAHPELAGTWQLPGLHPAEGGVYMFSTDRVEIRNGTVFVSHMHAGLIVLDMATMAKVARPEMVAFVLPQGRSAVPYLGYTTNPVVYDAIPYGRHVLYADLSGAFHSARVDDTVMPGVAW